MQPVRREIVFNKHVKYDRDRRESSRV